jgi:tetratricopeptide (TPR) repeat protein
LGERHQAVTIQTISGLGGAGKTQLAAAYAHRHVDNYEVVAWIRAEDGGIADLADLAGQLNLSVEGLTPEELARRVVRWLESRERSWLLVLDDVAHPAQLGALCPSSGPGRVLVTSRRRDFDQFGPVVVVGVFDELTAVGYLVARTGRAGERAAAGRLARAVGYLPLALSHAAAYCTTRTSFDGYLALLAGLPASELYDTNREAFYDRTVATTWRVSLDAAQAAAPLAGAVLAMAAYLAPDAIPRSLFDTLAPGEGPRERGRVDAALDVVHRYSLAEVTDTTVSVHRLLQKVVRDDAQIRGETTGAEAALKALAAAFPNGYDIRLPASWPWCEQLLPHVGSLSNAVLSWKDTAQGLVTLLNRASRYLLHAGGGQRVATFIRIALDSARSYLDADHPDTLAAQDNLARWLGELGRIDEAITHLRALLDNDLRVLGPDHPDTLATRGNLARWLGEVGRAEEAIGQLRALLDDRLRVLGPDHPRTLATRGNLARWLGEVGRIDEATSHLRALLDDSLRVLGPDHPDTLTIRGNLALWLGQAGRIEEAVTRSQALLEDSLRLLGPDHPDTLTSRGNLALWLGQAGRAEDAISQFEALLEDHLRVLGPEHPATLATHGSLARWLGEVGRIDEAISHLRALLDDRARVLGPDHPDTLATRGSLARWLGEENQLGSGVRGGGNDR